METCIRPDDTTATTQLCPANYDIISIPRKDNIGGSLALIYSKRLNTKPESSYSFNTMECSDFILENRKCRTIVLCLLYRPPSSNATDFMGELVDYIECNVRDNREIILMGDFNIHLNKPNDHDTITFNEFHFDLSAANAITDSTFCSYRKIKKINPIAFANNASHLLQDVQLDDLSAQDACDLYHSVMKDTTESHAPFKTKRVSNHPKLPWFNDDLAKAIRCRWRAERV